MIATTETPSGTIVQIASSLPEAYRGKVGTVMPSCLVKTHKVEPDEIAVKLNDGSLVTVNFQYLQIIMRP